MMRSGNFTHLFSGSHLKVHHYLEQGFSSKLGKATLLIFGIAKAPPINTRAEHRDRGSGARLRGPGVKPLVGVEVAKPP